MKRRLFLAALCPSGISAFAGCLSTSGIGSEGADIDSVEVWNSDDASHTFQVTLFDSDYEQIFERTVELSETSPRYYTSEKLSDAPDLAARIRADVDGKTVERDLDEYDTPIRLSVRYNEEQELEILVLV